MSEDRERLERQQEAKAELQDLLAKVVTKLEGQPVLLNKYVVLAEVYDTDGERGVYQLVSDGMRTWEAIGLLEHARACEAAAIVRSLTRDEEED